MAIGLITDHVRKSLAVKSKEHRAELKRLNRGSEEVPLDLKIDVLQETSQIKGINTIILDPKTSREDFIFNVNRMASLLIER